MEIYDNKAFKDNFLLKAISNFLSDFEDDISSFSVNHTPPTNNRYKYIICFNLNKDNISSYTYTLFNDINEILTELPNLFSNHFKHFYYLQDPDIDFDYAIDFFKDQILIKSYFLYGSEDKVLFDKLYLKIHDLLKHGNASTVDILSDFEKITDFDAYL